MKQNLPYSFTVLRYVHDVVTGEFLNVGVVVYLPGSGKVAARLRTKTSRIKDAFPSFDRPAFTKATQAIIAGLDKLEAGQSGLMLQRHTDAVSLATSVMPQDDSSFQWSLAGSGLTDDPVKTLQRLYDRFVGRYDHHASHGRSDEDIWRPVRKLLESRRLSVPFQEKVVAGPADEIEFKHAWKNGVWHAYEPVSFDLSGSEGIKDKARRLRGHLSAVADGTSEDLQLYLLLGAPHDPGLMTAFENAVEILERAPFNPKIVREEGIEALVDEIEKEMTAHQE